MEKRDNGSSRADELRKQIQELEAESAKSVSILEDLNAHQEELRLQNEQLREVQKELNDSRERYLQLFEHLPVGVIVLDQHGVIQEANRASVNLIGRRRSWILGHPFMPLLHQSYYESVSREITAAANGDSRSTEAQLLVKNDESICVALHFAPVRFNGAEGHVYVTIFDIRERRAALNRLQESEQRFRSVIENTPTGLCITGPDEKFEYVNKAYCDIYGYTEEELIGESFLIVVPEESRELLSNNHRDFLDGSLDEFGGLYTVIKKSGEEILVDTTSARFLASDGEPRKATFVVDVTKRRAQENDLRRLRHALDATGDAMFLVDQSTMRFIDVNQGAIDLLGYQREELLQIGPQDIDVQYSITQLNKTYDTLLSSKMPKHLVQTSHRKKDGGIIPMEMQVGILNENGKNIVIGIGRDITERLKTEAELRRVNRELDQILKERTTSLHTATQQLQLMNGVMENALDGVTITDDKGVIQKVNTQFTIVTGYTQEEAIGKTPRVLKSGHHDEQFYQRLWAKIQNTGEWQGEIWNRRKTGEVYPEWLVIRAIYDNLGVITNYVAVFHDLSELRAAEDAVEFQTNYDALTKLPNRPSFLERVDTAIRNARKTESGVAIAIVDVDDFRKVNESAGHTTGDQFLRSLADTLQDTVGGDATLARIGGDEFGVLIEGIADQWDYLETTNRIASICGSSITIESNAYELTLSVGVALYPDDADQAESLLNNAEAALYQVKHEPLRSDGGRVGMYTPALNEALRRRIDLESAMRRDLEEGRFVPYYQPRIDLSTGHVVGAEALARWIRSDGTVISPGEFIPLAEETGLIVRLGEAIFQRIRSDLLGNDLAPYRDDLTISFNASIKEILDPDFARRFDEALKDELFAKVIELELTESMIMDDIDTSMPVLESLKERGLSLAVDDFGTGYSSLYYLKRLPIDVLKIDKSFVDDLAHDPNDQAIVTTIIAMGRALNLSLVAEGIETTDQAQYLTSQGCAQGQGYLYGKPMALPDFAAYLMERKEVKR